MSNTVALRKPSPAEVMATVLGKGDLSKLSADEQARYYNAVCESVGLNPLTQPFAYITLNGKLTLYARKDCTDQLRSIHDISVTELTESEKDGVFIVTAKVANAAGRTDAAKGAVTISNLKGDALANALMKAETKAKRRATLSICGLGFLDETELETIPAAAKGPPRDSFAGMLGENEDDLKGIPAPAEGTETLPKKDARSIFERLCGTVDTWTGTRDELIKWMSDNLDRIGVLPADWQKILRLRCKEKLGELREWEKKEGAPPADDPQVPLDGEVIWDDPPVDEELWLRDLDGALSTTEDALSELAEQQQKVMAPMKDKVTPEAWKRAEALVAHHVKRVNGRPTVTQS